MLARVVIALVAAVSLAGCGADEERTAPRSPPRATTQHAKPPNTESRTTKTGSRAKPRRSNAYKDARDICASSGVEAIAAEYGTDPTRKEAARAYANDTGGAHVDDAFDGCLAGFAQTK